MKARVASVFSVVVLLGVIAYIFIERYARGEYSTIQLGEAIVLSVATGLIMMVLQVNLMMREIGK